MATATAARESVPHITNPFTEAERKILRPRPFLLPIDWAERHVIVGEDSPSPGRFSRHTMPTLTSPINSCCDPRYNETVGVAATQSGKSQALNQIRLAYNLEYRRRHTGFGIPNQKLASRVHKTKLSPMFRSVPSLAALLPEGGSGSKGGFPTEQILTNGALWMFMGAGSASDMSQATVEDLIVDETDKADEEAASGKEANPIAQMIRRTDAHQLTRHNTFTSTTTTPTGFIHTKFMAGTQGRPHYRCPFCGHWFPFLWDWDEYPLGWDDDTSTLSCERTAFYPCPSCGEKLREGHRQTMLRFPLWVHRPLGDEGVPAGEDPEHIVPCSVDELAGIGPFDEGIAIPDVGAFRVVGVRKATRTISFWWNRLSSPFTTLGLMAVAQREARDTEEDRHAVCIYDMALPWSGAIIDASTVTIDSILAHAKYSDYLRAHKQRKPFRWDDRHFICTAGVDIQKRELYLVVDVWQVDDDCFLTESWRIAMLIPYRYQDPDDPRAIYHGLEQVRDYLMRPFYDAEGHEFWPSRIGIDTGYQDTGRLRKSIIGGADYHVYSFCKHYGLGVWFPVKGEQSNDGKGIIVGSKIHVGGNKRNIMPLWHVDTDIAKTELHQMLSIQPGRAGFWHIPVDTPRDYARGIASEKRVVDLDDRNRERAEWVVEDAFNHPLDASVYSWAMARLSGVRPPRISLREEVDNVEAIEGTWVAAAG